MQTIERKKLILIIAVIATVILATIAIVVSVLTGQNSDPTPKPSVVPTVTPEGENTIVDGIEPGAVVGDPDEEGAPPKGAYDNDFSEDVGYKLLPESFDPSTSPTEGTIYDEIWARDTYETLYCELSTKNTSTEAVMLPLQNFKQDLNRVGENWATYFSENINYVLTKLENGLGERIPATDQTFYAMHCNADFDEGNHEH